MARINYSKFAGPNGMERGSDECESCVEIKNAWWDEQVDAAITAVNDLSV